MQNGDGQDDQENTTLARHMTLVEALEGKRTLTWDIWASPLYESRVLTANGRQVAEWAVCVLRKFLSDDFLQRVRTDGVEHALLSNAILTTLCPLIESRRVYEDLFRLAAQIYFCTPGSKGWRELQTTMRKNFDPTSWTHCLIQLELVALAKRQGWECEFEPKLSTGTPGDVRLEKDGQSITIEVTSVGMPDPMQKAAEYFHTMCMRILTIEVQYGVHVHGDVGDVLSPVQSDRWIKDIEKAANAMVQDRREYYVPGPAEAAVWVSPEIFRLDETHLEGPAGTTDILGRLKGRIGLKARQTARSGPTWIRLQEHSGLWLNMLQTHMSFHERVVAITSYIQEMMAPFPHISGIILSPGIMGLDDEPIEQTITLPDKPSVVALRRSFAQGRMRETVILSQSNHISTEAYALTDIYDHEGSWLEWAFEELGHPMLNAMFQ